MKFKSWLRYLAHFIFILGLIFLASFVEYKLKYLMSTTYKYDPFLPAIITLIFIILGASLGLEHLVRETKKEGRWIINLPKLILLGVPSLYLGLSLIAFYSGVPFLGTLYYPVAFLSSLTFGNVLQFSPVIQVLLGYFVITSFYKQSQEAYL